MLPYVVQRRDQAVGGAATPRRLQAVGLWNRHPASMLAICTGVIACAIALAVDPALANKFETIGSGVSGSTTSKRDWLRGMLFFGAGLSVLGSLAAVFMPRRNALYLNYSNWKASAAVLATIAAALVAFGLMV